jgi:putative ABC transport system permease protein
MGSLLQDLFYAGRILRKSPAFTLVAVLSLSVGIAANTTIFSVINAVLLRPLPHHNPGRLVALYELYSKDGQRFSGGPVTVGNFRDWRSQNTAFEEMAVFGNSDPATLTGAGEAERIQVQQASPEIFPLLGAKPSLGRTFVKEDLNAFQSSAGILSDAFWKRRFGGEPGVLGRAVTIDGQIVIIVGVMPPGFWIDPAATKVDVWRALNLDFNPAIAANRHNRYLQAMARLKPAITLEQAQVEMAAIGSRLALAYPKTNTGWTVHLMPLHEAFFGGRRSILYTLLVAVGCVLLIPCANVANLLMVRSAARRKETAIRSSVGASRLRLIRQWLTESALLALISGFLGLVWAFWGIDLFRSLAPPWVVSGVDIRIDAKVLLFTLGIGFLTGTLFGVVPALQASRTSLTESLKQTPQGSQGFAKGRLRDLLAVSEIALALILLIGAGLTIKSFLGLLQTQSRLPARSSLERTSLSFRAQISSADRRRHQTRHPSGGEFLSSGSRPCRGTAASRVRRHRQRPAYTVSGGPRFCDRRKADRARSSRSGLHRDQSQLFPCHAHPAHQGTILERARQRRNSVGGSHQRNHGAALLAQ